MLLKTSFSPPWRSLFVALLVFCSASASLCRAAADDTYLALVNTATQFRKDGKLAEARQTATTATLIAPDRYEAYFLAGVVAHDQKADAEAKPLIEKALALAPAATKPKIQEYLATLGPITAAPVATASPSAPPVAVAPTGPPPLDATAKRKLDALLLIPQEAEQATSPEQRKQLLGEFLDKSAPFATEHPEQTALWVTRAVAAMELNLSRPARDAAQQLLALAHPDDKVQKVLAMLERRGWTEKVVTPAPVVIADLDLQMLGIPVGSFTMGSPAGEANRQADEAQFQVTLTKPFYLGRTDVTQGQWQAIMGTTVRQQFDKVLAELKKNKESLDGWVLAGEGPNYPMYYVSWDEAVAFCQKLTERERAAGRLPAGYAYTLPTEAQWEYACRAETNDPYSGDLDAMAWYATNSGGTTHPVGTKQPNGWGLYDMHGNVWQWCLDWYGDYPGGSVTDPKGQSSGAYRVLRGGSWYYDAALCRSAARYDHVPGNRNRNVGFRLALSFSP